MENSEGQVHQWVAHLEEGRVERSGKPRLWQENDELSSSGQTVADMLWRLPEEHRAWVMFDMHKQLFERQQQRI